MTCYGVEPLLDCALGGALKAAAGINNVVPIVHGPMGCASGHRIIPLLAGKEPLVATTSLTEVEVIMGTEERLREAIVKANQIYKPSLIVVILTCAVSLTGEIHGHMFEKLGESIGCPIFVVDGSGITGDEIDGFRWFYEEFRRFMDKHNPVDCRSEGVELVGLTPADFNFKEDAPVLESIVRQATGKTVKQILFNEVEFDAASWRIYHPLYVGHLWNLAETLVPAPVGAAGSLRWAGEMAKQLNTTISPDFISKAQQAEQAIQRLKQSRVFDGLRVGIEAESWWGLGLAEFLTAELGVEVLLSSDALALTYQEQRPCAIETYVDMSNLELLDKFCEQGVDLVFGTSYIKDPEINWVPFWQPVWHVIDEQESILGLQGVQHLLQLLQAIEENKNEPFGKSRKKAFRYKS
jgi:nitrogenase molybdenum-iron protein alpha/beta subunit